MILTTPYRTRYETHYGAYHPDHPGTCYRRGRGKNKRMDELMYSPDLFIEGKYQVFSKKTGERLKNQEIEITQETEDPNQLTLEL